jgi:hypothetical protein
VASIIEFVQRNETLLPILVENVFALQAHHLLVFELLVPRLIAHPRLLLTVRLRGTLHFDIMLRATRNGHDIDA